MKNIHCSRWLLSGLVLLTLSIVALVIVIDRGTRPEPLVQAHPDAPVADALWVPNDTVRDVLVTNDTVYIGGSFTQMGPYTGAGVPLDAASGNLVQPYAFVSPATVGTGITGAVLTVISDGSGGWYIGGDLERVGGVDRSGLAHVLANGTLDQSFSVQTVGRVSSLLLNGTTLYVGGNFSSLGGQARNGLGALNVTTGSILSWNPGVEAGKLVNALALSGSTLFIGGDFTSVDGVARNSLAAIDTTATVGGTYATVWDPNANKIVYDLLLDGTTLYAGGDFTNVDGTARNHAAAIDTTATVGGTYTTAWDPNSNGSVIFALEKSGTTIFAGGNFTTIGGATRARLAGLDATTGLSTTFNANVDATGGNVYSLALSGSTLYVGGDFVTVASQSRPFLAAVDMTGTLLGWDPRGCDNVLGLAVQGSQVYAGGNFACMGSEDHFGLAALDRTTGAPRNWHPLSSFTSIESLTTDGSLIYAGGSFGTIGGQARNNLAAIDPTTGLATAWDPNASSRVLDLEYRNGTIYAAGAFTTIGGATRNRIAALSTTTGLATAWDPNASGRVSEMFMDTDTVYVAAGSGFGPGGFTTIGGQSRNRLAELDLSTGLATAWDPNPNNYVQTVERDGSTVYVGGGFTTIGGASRNYLAAVDATSGLATSWDPSPDATITRLHVNNGILFAGGTYTSMAGQSRSVLSSFDTGTGALSEWNPNGSTGGATNFVVADIVTGSPILIVGGKFILPGLGASNLKSFALTAVEFSVEVLEGTREQTAVGLPVQLSAVEQVDSTVDYEPTGGTAVYGVDYILPAGTLNIPAGVITQDIPLTVLGDGVGQPDKTVQVTLTDPSVNTVLGDKTVLVYTIKGAAASSPQRISGDTPQEQAISTSQQRFSQTGAAQGAIIARDDVAVDAFTAGPLANRLDLTLLLTDSNTLPTEVIAELQRALNGTNKTIYLAGGEEALQPGIVTQLQELGYSNIQRFDGAHRAQTARFIAEEITTANVEPASKIFLTEKAALVDALAIGAVAGRDPLDQKVTPILVTSRGSAKLDGDVTTFLQQHPEVTEVEIIGGVVAISQAAEQGLSDLSSITSVSRTAGADRFATNIAIVEKHNSGPTAFIAARGDRGGIPGARSVSLNAAQGSTEHFFSALLATTFAAEQDMPLLLVTPSEVPASIADFITANAGTISKFYIMGSLSQISQAVEDQLKVLVQ